MVTTSYPAVSGRQRRHLHGADRRVGRRARARGPRRRALAPARRARAGRTRRPFSFLPVRAGSVAERFRLRGGAARGRQRCAARHCVAAPLALAAGWFAALRVARRHRATVMHGHWVVPGGFTARGGGASAAAGRQPARIRRLRRRDVRARAASGAAASSIAPAPSPPAARIWRGGRSALGADPREARGRAVRRRHGPVPPAAGATRRRCARNWAWPSGTLLVFAAGRLVRKKGFEHLIDAWARSRGEPAALLAIAGDGDLRDELRERARAGRRRRSRAVPRQSVPGRRRQRTSRPPTSWSSRRSRTTAATSTACRTSCSRRWPRARR